MAEFKNQTVGKFDGDEKPEYVSVWFDENEITSFYFHSVMINDHRVHGVSVDPRHVWASISAFSSEPTEAQTTKGHRIYVSTVWLDSEGTTREIRAFNRHGKPLARMVKTGYQELNR